MSKPAADGLGTLLRRLLELLDGDLLTVYAEAGLDYRPRYTPVMKALADGSSLTIKEISSRCIVSHSAASQTVARMLSSGLLVQTIGDDARERRVSLSQPALVLLPILEQHWAATTLAAEELERETSTSLRATVAKVIEALEERSFRQRILCFRDGDTAGNPVQDDKLSV